MNQEILTNMRNSRISQDIGMEELSLFPAKETLITVPARDGHLIPIYRIVPDHLPENGPMIINFHGGGFVKGRCLRDRLFCSRMALTLGCMVWDVDYRLAPEFPFPAAVLESYDAVSYAFAHAGEIGIDPKKIFLTGHSAGGNLAATVCMKASEESSDPACSSPIAPAGLAIEYAPVDLYTDPRKKPEFEGDMPAEDALAYNAFYCPKEAAKDPYATLLFANDEQLSGFPPSLIITSGLDRLCEEAEKLAARLIENGVLVTCRRFLNSHHGFTINQQEEWEASTRLFLDFLGCWIH